ncbi:class I SAM-dependent methyltransferase [Xanthomonas sacchari]|uniref:class I SAM-dependent methyltransferase n=1 Tax=Xanthomonas sacchari TaxID=56458 RepID=UPI002435335D|nr:methyltransferase domain-containing protein [Xanthomonas sacchari]
MDFRAHIRYLAQDKQRILEIGPSYNPILPKKDGFKVFVVDHATQDELVAKYQAYGVADTSSIEQVDFVTIDLSTLQGEEKFDLIVASHLIEHTPDLIKFVKDCSSLLTDTGTLALLVPDKRYCFDALRPLTSPGAVIDAHLHHQTRHVGGLLDHYSYFVRNNGQMAWGSQEPLALETIHSAEICKDALEKCLSSDGYMDAHKWVFTPSSFRFLIQELYDYHLIDMRIDQSHDTLGFEFFATLNRQSTHAPEDKLVLLQTIQQEETLTTPLARIIQKAADTLGIQASSIEEAAEHVVRHALQSRESPKIELTDSATP